eukprot:TRINITY_DN23722_c0_g1_i2.p1 TRINITY_DN23722_c0_g1~~TRINITY_DN23722_c0_g1_i2.p1  ORF type:complete len:1394 (+),score=513.34 TRINITY_DN23722_c0_g1_i2:5417-9598(+)
MQQGQKIRHIEATDMNERSSRSHTVFKIIIESREMCIGAESDDAIRVATLNFVDLAGSERADAAGTKGQRLKEGGHINKSLLTLGSVISKLAESPHGHIPYRDSKLTRILQPALGGNSLAAIVCTMAPAEMHAEESHSTLKFALRATKVENKAVINEVLDDQAMLKRYRKTIKELQYKLDAFSLHPDSKILEEEKQKVEEDRKAVEETREELQKKLEKIEKMILSSDTTRKRKKPKHGAIRRETWCPSSQMPLFLFPSRRIVDEKEEVKESGELDELAGDLLDVFSPLRQTNEDCEPSALTEDFTSIRVMRRGREEIFNLELEVSALKKENESLKAIVDEQQKERENMEEQMSRLYKEKEEVGAARDKESRQHADDICSQESTIESLITDLEERKMQQQKTESMLSELQEKCTKLQNLLNEEEVSKMRILQESRDAHDREISKLQSINDELKQKVAEIDSQCGNLRTSLQSEQQARAAESRQHEEKVRALKDTVESLETLLKQNEENAYKEGEEIISQLRSENDSMALQISALEEEIVELDSEKAELLAKSVEAECRCHELESDLEGRKLAHSEMEKGLNIERREKEVQQNLVRDMQPKMEALNTEYMRMLTVCEDQKQQLEAHESRETEILKLKWDLESAQKNLAEQQEKCIYLQQMIDTNEEKFAEQFKSLQTAHVEELEMRVQEVAKEHADALKEKEHLIEDLQKQKERLQQRVSELEEEMESSTLSRLATPRSSMKSGVGVTSLFATRDKEARELERKSEKLENEKEHLKKDFELSRSKMQTELDQQKEEIGKLRQEAQTLRKEVKSSEMKVIGLEKERDRLQKDMDSSREKEKEKGSKLKSMKQEKRELLQEKSSIESENRDLMKKLKRLETELQRIRDVHDKEDTSRKDFVSRIAKLEREKQELEKQLKRNDDILSQAQEKSRHDDLVLKQLADEKKEMEKQVELAQSSNVVLEETASSLDIQLGKLKATILDREEELQKLRDEFDTLRFRCDELETELKEKTGKIEMQENEIQNLQSACDKFGDELRKGHEEKEELMCSLQQSNSLMETLGSDRDEMQKQLIEHEAKEENLLDSLARKNEEIALLKSKLAELEESMTDENFKLRERLDVMTLEVADLKKEKEENAARDGEEIAMLQKQKSEQQEKIAVQESIQVEVETLLEDMNEMSEKNSELSTERDILLQENAELQEELETKNSKVAQLVQEKEELLAAQAEMQDDLSRNESRIQDFERGIASLQAQLASTEESFARSEAEKECIFVEHKRVEQDLRDLKSKSHDADSSNSVLAKEIKTLKSENEDLIEMLNDLRKRRAKRSFGCDTACIEEKERLRKELAAKEAEIGELVEDVGMLRGENDELRRKMFEKRGSMGRPALEGRTGGKENAVKRR